MTTGNRDLQKMNDPYSGYDTLARTWGTRLMRAEPLSRHTTARVGGPADLYVEALTSEELRQFVVLARHCQTPYLILGGGSNVLISDGGVRGLVIANKADRFEFQPGGRVWAESGVGLPTLARACIEHGYANLEWAIGIPGTLGGAVCGNAGAHGGDIARDLIEASVVTDGDQAQMWSKADLEFGYRTSRLKSPVAGDLAFRPVILAAAFQLQMGNQQELEARAAQIIERRKRVQPAGASMGSIFKNPPGDYAGRLIEAAGLKGKQIGQAQISPQHANFFINLGGATASDVKALIDLARHSVQAQCGVELELEIEMIGMSGI